jgi:hypothetical protein
MGKEKINPGMKQLLDASAKSSFGHFSPPSAFCNSLIILTPGFCILTSAAAS